METKIQIFLDSEIYNEMSPTLINLIKHIPATGDFVSLPEDVIKPRIVKKVEHEFKKDSEYEGSHLIKIYLESR